ncbi:hypothetical protein XA68_15309 [Ophiocordyceps unilateralis]|uniref:Velvet domain-containing protein n=1 Tax=Ophiocordyceps unilateralis TaxID=268505 RepID=A0A2A9P8N3_OPHUN|nr:hypothetical protein XA68_15309 [Ophiocordyceps unilateralis]
MNTTQPPPEHIRSAYLSPANATGHSNGAALVYLSNSYQHQLPPRPTQLSSPDAQCHSVQPSPQSQPHAQPHALTQPMVPPHHQPVSTHDTLLQHHSSMPSSSQMQPLPPPPGNSSRPEVDEATGRKYQLDVVQQPRRARMCGFGDKDRRPITPPPCVRLIITDAVTGREIDCNSIDHSMFVLNVDLWNQDGTREVNLVRSSTGSPSISSTTPYSYTTLNGGDASMASYTQHVLPSHRDASYNPSQILSFVSDYQMQSGYSQASPTYPSNGSYLPAQQFFPQHQAYRQDATVPPASAQVNVAHFTRNGVPVAPGFLQDQNSLTRMAMVGGQPQGMFTRNLIGSLAASAFRLSDTSDHIGIWFVLQDLSVRTEGSFRLRFSFVNVGARGGARRDCNTARVNTGRAPILASCFSDVFIVYSAKKFPGTQMLKAAATMTITVNDECRMRSSRQWQYIKKLT